LTKRGPTPPSAGHSRTSTWDSSYENHDRTPSPRRRRHDGRHRHECRLLHRADWQYLGTRNDEQVAPYPIDSYRCDRCEQAWDKVN
jgi:hypothetical protein